MIEISCYIYYTADMDWYFFLQQQYIARGKKSVMS